MEELSVNYSPLSISSVEIYLYTSAPNLSHGFPFSHFYLEGLKIILEQNIDSIRLGEGNLYHYKVHSAPVIEGRLCRAHQSVSILEINNTEDILSLSKLWEMHNS